MADEEPKDTSFTEFNESAIHEIEALLIRMEAMFKTYSKWQGIMPKPFFNHLASMGNFVHDLKRGTQNTLLKNTRTIQTGPEQKTREHELKSDMKKLVNEFGTLVKELEKLLKEIDEGEHLIKVTSIPDAGGPATQNDLKNMFMTFINIDNLATAINTEFGKQPLQPANQAHINTYLTNIIAALPTLRRYVKNEQNVIAAIDKLDYNIARLAGAKEIKTINAIKFALKHFKEDLNAVAILPGGAPHSAAANNILGNTGAASSKQVIQNYIGKLDKLVQKLFDEIEKDEQNFIIGVQNVKTKSEETKRMMNQVSGSLQNYLAAITHVETEIKNVDTQRTPAAGGLPVWNTNDAKKIHTLIVDANRKLGDLSSANSLRVVFSNLVANFKYMIDVYENMKKAVLLERADIKTILDDLKAFHTYLDGKYT